MWSADVAAMKLIMESQSLNEHINIKNKTLAHLGL